MKKPITPDDVCEKYSGTGVKITIKDLEESILIEGTSDALTFLAQLFQAQANAGDTGFQIFPSGAGRLFFSEDSRKRIYIHRID